jgi:hypothetical protein
MAIRKEYDTFRNKLLKRKSEKIGFSRTLSDASYGAYVLLEEKINQELKSSAEVVPDYASIIDFEVMVGLAPDTVQLVIEVLQPLFPDHAISFSDHTGDYSALEIKVGNNSKDVITVKIVSSGDERQSYLQEILKKTLSEKQIATELIKMKIIILVITPEMDHSKIEHRFISNVKDLGFTGFGSVI